MSSPDPKPIEKVVVVGSLNMDSIWFIRTHESSPDHEKVRDQVDLPGGHGANQAVAVYRAAHHRPIESANETTTQPLSPIETNIPPKLLDFNVQVHMIGRVGDDGIHGPGQRIVDELKSNNIDTKEVLAVPGTQTGAAYISVDNQGVTYIKTVARANAHLTPFEINGSIEGWDSNIGMVLVQLEVPLDTIRTVIEKASSQKIPVIFNPAPVEEENSLREDETIFKVDHLILNAKCADRILRLKPDLTEKDRYDVASRSMIHMRYVDACEQFHRLGSSCVIITLGPLGVVGSYLEPEDNMGLRSQKTYIFGGKKGPGKVCDQTGASDVFIGTYAVEILRQMRSKPRTLDIGVAIEVAIMAGGLSIATYGSMPSSPWRDEVFQCKEDNCFTSTSPFDGRRK